MTGETPNNVTVRGHRIVIEGPISTTNSTRRICAALEEVNAGHPFGGILLDFGNCTEATQAAMLPLLPVVNRYRMRNALSIGLVRPRDDSVDRSFIDGNWAHIIDPERHAGVGPDDDVIPALQFENETEALQIPEQVIEVVMRSTAVGPELLRMLEWSLYEILDNVINHSNAAEGGFVQATPLEEHVEFVVADTGIGIANSLGMRDEVDALREAVKQGVTRDETSNQGNGLYGSLQVAAISGGEFEIMSGSATLEYPPDTNGDAWFDYDLPFPGTAVRARIGLAESGVLQRTLRFGGVDHDPVYGYVERQFETDEGELVFNVKERAARDVRTRGGGQRVRQQLENLLQSAETITVDFEGVEVISSSFADEVFGRLFVSLGPRTFTKRVILTNVNEDIDGLIDFAIDQRWRTATGS